MAQQQQPQGLHSLSTILKRLEAVTSRLEDVAVSQQSSGHGPRSPTASGHDNIAGAAVAGAVGAAAGAAAGSASGGPPPPPPPPPPPAAAPAAEESPASKAYGDLIENQLREFVEASKKVGGIVEQASALFPPLFEAQHNYVKMASAHAKPENSALPELLKPQADAIGAILQAKDKLGRGKEGRDWGDALSVVGEGAPAFGWVQVEKTPAPYIGDAKDSSQFWVNRVIKAHKEGNPDAVAWAKSFIALLNSLQEYVKQWHTTGVAWNPKGPAAPSSVPSGSGSANGGGAPPPPPPPPAASASSGGGGGHAALLADLNKGSGVTSGLRKVDQSQMTHKHPELRASSVVPDRPTSPSKRAGPPVKAKPASFTKKKPARTELEDGNKWIIENHEDNREILIDQTALNHTVHVFGCKNTVIRITGKVNAVAMVNCKKTSLVVESLVSSLSITSSPSFEVQITGVVPTILIDATDSGQVYLSDACKDTVEIITAKTSAINISVPSGDDGDYTERAIPEQMKTRVINGKLVTEIVEHAG